MNNKKSDCGTFKSKKRSCPNSGTYYPAVYTEVTRIPDLLAKKPPSTTPTRHQSTPTGKSKSHAGAAASEQVRALKQENLDALKKAEETKNKEILAARNKYNAKIKALQNELKQSQNNCKQLQMQILALNKELSAALRNSSRQAAQPHHKIAGRQTSVKPRKEPSPSCAPAVRNDHMERLTIDKVQDKTVAKIRAEMLKEKENEIKKMKDEMSREVQRIYSVAQEAKEVAVSQILKEKEKEMNRMKDELRRCKEEGRFNAERVKEMEITIATLQTQNESMHSLRARQSNKEKDKTKTEMRRELDRNMHVFKVEVLKQKEKEMDELRATLFKEKEQEIGKVRAEMNARCHQQMEQQKASILKEKRKEMDMLRAEFLRENEREVHEAKAEMTQKIAREMEQFKIEMMKEKGKEQWRGRDGEIVKLKAEMAIERDKEVKRVRDENEKEMEKMKAMVRDKEEEIAKFKQSEREMEKFRSDVVKNKLELDKLRATVKEKDMEKDELYAVICKREKEIEALKLEAMKERVVTAKHAEEKHVHAHTSKEKEIKEANRSSTSLACSGHGDALCAKELNRTNTKAKSAPRVHGLFNLGNTCYMNAALQCVYATVAFKDAIMKENLLNGELTTEFRNILQEMLNASKEAVKPLQLKLLVQNSFRGFSGSSQQDSQEFLTALLEKLHEELSTNGTASESVVSKLFHGQLQTTLHCEKCHQDTIKCDPLMFLSVSIPPELPRAQQGKRSSIELTDCLETFTKEEFFGDNCWFCTNCNKHADMRRKASVSDPPQVLIVYLKRFRQDAYGIRHKITATVHFTRNLDLTPFVTSGKKTTYSLYAIINHAGSISTGHYTAFCKHGTQWYQFDDARVTALNENEIVTSNAYVLFYTRDCYSS